MVITSIVKENLSTLSNDKIEIYPNPNSGIFRVKINCETEGENKITVVSQYGAIVFEQTVYCTGSSIVKQIELKNTPKGMLLQRRP